MGLDNHIDFEMKCKNEKSYFTRNLSKVVVSQDITNYNTQQTKLLLDLFKHLFFLQQYKILYNVHTEDVDNL